VVVVLRLIAGAVMGIFLGLLIVVIGIQFIPLEVSSDYYQTQDRATFRIDGHECFKCHK
jgi:hypothetical protein